MHISSSFKLSIHKLFKLGHLCEIEHQEAVRFRSSMISTHLINICYVTYVSIHNSQNTAYIWSTDISLIMNLRNQTQTEK